MHKVEGAEELEALLNTPAEELPDKARPPVTGFYAEWVKAPPGKRRQMARLAFRREEERIARRERRENVLLR
jgi:hypothetical protein